jgi:hypothetical protein
VVRGESNAGKTELLNTIAATCARQGETVLKIDLGGKTTGNSWRDVLQAITDQAAAEGLSADRLKVAARAPGRSGSVIKGFQEALAASVGAGGSLLLVLDGLSDWEPNLVRNTLLPELCGPYLLPSPPAAVDSGQAPGGNVRMLLAIREDWSDVWRARPAGWQPVEVGEFLDEWDRAVTHFEAHWISRVTEDRRENFRNVVNTYRTDGTRSGRTLQLIRWTAESMGQ